MKREPLDEFDLANGARKLVVDKILLALIDQISASSPNLRDDVKKSVDAYLDSIEKAVDPLGRKEEQFIALARSYTEYFVRSPD